MNERQKKQYQERKDNPDETPLLVWGIPTKLKARFKARCARRGFTMKGALINLMKGFLKDA